MWVPLHVPCDLIHAAATTVKESSVFLLLVDSMELWKQMEYEAMFSPR